MPFSREAQPSAVSGASVFANRTLLFQNIKQMSTFFNNGPLAGWRKEAQTLTRLGTASGVATTGPVPVER